MKIPRNKSEKSKKNASKSRKLKPTKHYGANYYADEDSQDIQCFMKDRYYE